MNTRFAWFLLIITLLASSMILYRLPQQANSQINLDDQTSMSGRFLWFVDYELTKYNSNGLPFVRYAVKDLSLTERRLGIFQVRNVLKLTLTDLDISYTQEHLQKQSGLNDFLTISLRNGLALKEPAFSSVNIQGVAIHIKQLSNELILVTASEATLTKKAGTLLLKNVHFRDLKQQRNIIAHQMLFIENQVLFYFPPNVIQSDSHKNLHKKDLLLNALGQEVFKSTLLIN